MSAGASVGLGDDPVGGRAALGAGFVGADLAGAGGLDREPGLIYGRPEPAIEAVAGAPAIKAATLSVTVDYETDAPLA